MPRFVVFVFFSLFSPNSLSASASTEQITAFDLVSCCVCIGSLEQTRYADFCASVLVRVCIRACVCVCEIIFSTFACFACDIRSELELACQSGTSVLIQLRMAQGDSCEHTRTLTHTLTQPPA